MPPSARTPSVSRRGLLLAGLGAPWFGSFAAEGLSARLDGVTLLVFSPQMHFIAGKPLERLKDGGSVVFLAQLSLSLDSNSTFLRRVPERFVVSYDLWEEKFAVTRLGTANHSATHLSAPAAERWCFDNLSVSTAGLAPDRQFWIRLEVRATDPRDQAGVVGEGINLTRLIELFSRPPGSQQPHWSVEGGPWKLAELKRADSRGPRTG